MTSLHLQHLALSHVRSHKRAVIELDRRPVAIHGRNGAGKTNILEALSLLSPGRGLRNASAEDIMRKPEGVGWKISARLSSLDQLHEIETSSDRGAARTVRIDGKTAPQIALGRLARILWLIPSMDRLWIEGAEGRRRFLDRMTLSFFPDHAQATLDYEKAMRDRNRLLKDQVRDVHWYSALEAQMAAAGARIIAARSHAVERLQDAQAGAATAFPVADLELSGPTDVPEGQDEDELRSVFAEMRNRDMAAGRTLSGPHRADLVGTFAAKGIPARDCSTGEQKALLISLILANARALADEIGAPPLLLLDEVSAHLDAGRRSSLYDEILALGAQAWMTGTGPELFAELEGSAQVLEVIEAGDESKVVLAS